MSRARHPQAANPFAFTGFGPDLAAFYRGLAADNSKAYWAAHKADYDTQVRGPLELLLGELADEFGEAKVFRPNRDIRFSADKSPYKTSQAPISDEPRRPVTTWRPPPRAFGSVAAFTTPRARSWPRCGPRSMTGSVGRSWSGWLPNSVRRTGCSVARP